MKLIIKDAYYKCCGLEFRSKDALLEHHIFSASTCPAIQRILKQHDKMWQVLKRADRALWMREELDKLG